MILTLLGFIVGPARKFFQLEQTLDDVKILKENAVTMNTNIAVINAQYADIQKQLEQMNWRLRKINDKGDN